jgi:Fic family protein
MNDNKWIWQNNNWQHWDIDYAIFQKQIEQVVRATAPLQMLTNELSEDNKLKLSEKVILNESLKSSYIENEVLDRESVRSSICNKLGLNTHLHSPKSITSFVEMMFVSVYDFNQLLSEKDICYWHYLLFKDKKMILTPRIGEYRNSLMRIISGRYGKEKVHFIAPCEDEYCLKKLMQDFITYYNQNDGVSDYIKAAIVKFYFITIHPFDDGNGRISRLLAERYLAKAEQSHLRLYSISSQFEKHKQEYYDILQAVQTNTLGIEKWITFFLQQVENAAKESLQILQKINYSTKFWDKYRDIDFNSRQKKLLIRLLETDDFIEGISRKKYKNLTKTTDITASRDLKDLVDKQILITTGGGRSIKYLLKDSV